MSKFIIFFLLISSSTFAAPYIVNQMTTVPGYDVNFFLTNSKDDSYHLNIDCQSYFNKLDGYDANSNLLFEYYLSSGECFYILESIQKCIEDVGSKCIESSDIFSQDCSCN